MGLYDGNQLMAMRGNEDCEQQRFAVIVVFDVLSVKIKDEKARRSLYVSSCRLCRAEVEL